MGQPSHFSHLTPARQALVRICQALNFGTIRGVRVEGGGPFLDAATLLAEERLDLPEEPRPEIRLNDFELSEEWRRLLARLDDIGSGMIEQLEVRQGIPRKVIFESKLSKHIR